MRQAHNEYLITPIKNYLYLMLMPLKHFSSENKINDLSMGIFTLYFSFLLFFSFPFGQLKLKLKQRIRNLTGTYSKSHVKISQMGTKKNKIPMQDNINE